MQNLWHDLSPGPDIPNIIHVVTEIPKGSRNKYEYDKDIGAFRLDRVLYSPVHYPGDYGFVPQTFYDDGDPLDVLVVTNLPTFTGCIVESRPIGMFQMLDRGQADDKVLAVLNHDPFFHEYVDYTDLPAHYLREVEHFFTVYKDLEASGSSHSAGKMRRMPKSASASPPTTTGITVPDVCRSTMRRRGNS